MRALAAFLSRHRWPVALAWLAIVAVSLPFASRQTENLTGGGFRAPGSQSATVEDLLERDFAGAQKGAVGAVLRAEEAASGEQLDAGLERLRGAVAAAPEIRLGRGSIAAARAELERERIAVVPLLTSKPTSELNDAASDLREALRPGEPEGDVTPYLVGQPAAYAGLQELTKEDLERAEVSGFPIVALILLSVFGSFAAAALPLALGFASVIVTGALI